MDQNALRRLCAMLTALVLSSFSMAIAGSLSASNSLSLTQAPITLVQQVAATTTGDTTLAATLPEAVGAGNLIVVCVSVWPDNPLPTPISDDQTNDYNLANIAFDSWAAWSAIFYAGNAKPGTTTVTLQSGGSPQMSIIVAEFTNVAAVSPLDGAAGDVGFTTNASSGDMTPTAADDLIVGTGQHEGTSVTTAGPGFIMSLIAAEDNDTHMPLALEYQILSATNPVSATFNLDPAYEWSVNGALFKHAPPIQVPSLEASVASQRLTLTWPAWASNWTLWAALDLSLPNAWSAVTNAVVNSNGVVSLTVPIGQEVGYFRLKSP